MSSGVSGSQMEKLLRRTCRYRSRNAVALEITEEAILLRPKNFRF